MHSSTQKTPSQLHSRYYWFMTAWFKLDKAGREALGNPLEFPQAFMEGRLTTEAIWFDELGTLPDTVLTPSDPIYCALSRENPELELLTP
jgi:hypothetical protein